MGTLPTKATIEGRLLDHTKSLLYVLKQFFKPIRSRFKQLLYSHPNTGVLATELTNSIPAVSTCFSFHIYCNVLHSPSFTEQSQSRIVRRAYG